MADENEDQWLYGDSTDGKEYVNIPSEIQQNDSTKTQEKSQIPEDLKMEGTNETPSEVHARPNLLFTIIYFFQTHVERYFYYMYFNFEDL